MAENDKETEKMFVTNPKIMENYNLLQEIGVFSFIDSLTRKVHSYKTLLTKGLNIFNHTSTSEIMDATVEQISYNFLPAYIAFIWKPIQNRPDVTIRIYHNYKAIDMGLKIDNIVIFENYFHDFPKPTSFEELSKKLNNDKALEPFNAIQPDIVVPILGPFGLYGVILIGRKLPSGDYTAEELEFLHQLISFVSQAIKNHLHYEHSLRDVKTGLYNHGYFMVRLKEEVAMVKHSFYSSAVIVMDVDKFKNFNDSYGHLAGDQVLEKLSQAIRQNIRGNDVPSRFGGEEFTIMLPHADIDTAWAISERLRTCVAEMKVPWEVPLPQVTISLGVFAFDQNSTLEPIDILRRADEALYVSKDSGRNRSTIWVPDLLKGNTNIITRNF